MHRRQRNGQPRCAQVGVSGAAPDASLVGYNLLQNLTLANEADAMTRAAASNWVSSNSWGAA
ncbi:MAG TPA: hypothetical protein PLP08_11685, partial [Plasticicumulans sp.]|uniref:hypothetical protein n=1 Tax=Plasticicumulans sp. TaxID=2307179 RepID=UPI002BCB7635